MLTQKDFEKQYAELMQRIQKQATPFPNDSAEKKRARIKRSLADPLFFCVTYLPHYFQVREGYRECWKYPDKEYDFIDAGFAPFHSEFFRIANLHNTFSIVPGFRESGKDTIFCTADPLHKLLFAERWFIPVIAQTETKAESKVVPVKLELEKNLRIINDFGTLQGSVEWSFGSFVTSTGRLMRGYGRDQALHGESNMGHRPDHIVLTDINDPTKPDSPAVVQKYVDSFKEDIRYSVNSVNWGGVFHCNWTVKSDIVDELMTGKNTKHLNKPVFRALVSNELKTKEDRAIAKQCRDAGFPDKEKSAWEYRHPTLSLLKDRANDPDTFDTQMMMRPRSRKDQRFKDTYFRFHTREQLAARSYTNYSFVDSSAKDANDYKSVITVGVAALPDGTIHVPVRRAYIQQGSIDEMMDATYRQRREFHSKLVGVETNGFQILLKREYMRLQKKYKELLPFLEVEHVGESKESRIERIVPFVKEGIITFDLSDPDQELLIRQLKAFPNAGQVSAGGLGDDGPDALAGCVELIEKYPHAGEVAYQSVKKREAIFEDGAY
jgi:predicted phage terminase large subunit-like protein